MSTIIRESRETKVHVTLEPGGTEPLRPDVSTTIPFLDHMVTTLGRYAGVSLHVAASGDLRHHIIEDVGITMGQALLDALPEACARYGHALVPMDDALVEVALDAGGRFWYEGRLPSRLYEHFLRSFAENARITLHVRVLRGRDRHHIVEAAFKATGLALCAALQPAGAVFSTKGSVVIRRDPD